jgi:hypothetical protein
MPPATRVVVVIIVTGQSVERVARKAVCAGSQKRPARRRGFYAALWIKRVARKKNFCAKFAMQRLTTAQSR